MENKRQNKVKKRYFVCGSIVLMTANLIVILHYNNRSVSICNSYHINGYEDIKAAGPIQNVQGGQSVR